MPATSAGMTKRIGTNRFAGRRIMIWRAALLSLLLLGLFIAVWHLATPGRGPGRNEGPGICQARWGDGEPRQISDARPRRRRPQNLAAPEGALLRPRLKRQGHWYPTRLFDRAGDDRVSHRRGGG